MTFRRFPVRFEKYILLDRINVGGMAEVYYAKITGEEEFQRLLAIKCMRPSVSANEEYVRMFVDEAKLAAQLTHPNIVQILELGRTEERLYIAMELVSGRDVGNVLKVTREASRPLPLQFSVYVIAKAAEGLDFAHHKVGDDRVPLNLIHRDVSPQNIMVSYDGAVKVADFGVAKADTRVVQTTGNILRGKAAYMSPEQVRGRDLDKRSDVFALGSCLYEMIVGERLFQGHDRFAVMEKVRNAEVPSLPAKLPNNVEGVVRRALAREPIDRFQTAEEMAEALTPFLIDESGGAVYGARQAGELMSELFADQITKMGTRLRAWKDVRANDCVRGDTVEKTLILYQSTFEITSAVRRRTEEISEQLECASVDRTVLVSADSPLRPQTLWLLLAATAVFVVVLATLWSLSAEPPAPPPPAPVASHPQAPVSPPPPQPAPVEPVESVEVAEPSEPQERGKRRRREAGARFGWVSIRADGVHAAKILIDGNDAGFSPLIGRKVRVGKHRVRVVEQREGGGPGRVKVIEVNVTARHTRRAPLRIVEAM